MFIDLWLTMIARVAGWLTDLLNEWPTQSLAFFYTMEDAVYQFLQLEVVGGLFGMIDANTLMTGVIVLFGLFTLTLILRVAAAVTSSLTPGGLI